MSSPIYSRLNHPDACCERCVYGRGPHADWCPEGKLIHAIADAYEKASRIDDCCLSNLLR